MVRLSEDMAIMAKKNWLASAIVITAAGIPATTYSESDPILLKRIAEAQGACEVDPVPKVAVDHPKLDQFLCRVMRDEDERPVPYG